MSRPSLVSDMVLGVMLPIAIVAAGIFGFIVLGEAKPEQKGIESQDLASRLAALPEADVSRIQAFDTSAQTLDIEIQGSVVPFRELSIGAEVTGRIVFKDPNCRQGRYVNKGQLLFRIDPQDYELEVQRLAKMLEQDYAALRELEQELANIQKSLDVVNEEVQLHDAEITRLTQVPEGIVSDTELDAARRARLTSVNQQVTLQNQIDLTQKRRIRLEAAEKLAETQLKKAQLDLSRCEVLSPVDGVIVRELMESDSFVQRGSTLATIEDTGNVEVSCSLRMDQLYWVLNQADGRVDSPSSTDPAAMAGRYALPPTPVTVEFQVAGREQRTYDWEGVLSGYEGSGIDPQSRTVPCRVRVEKPYQYMIDGKERVDDRVSGPPALVRGMFVNLKVHTRPKTPLMLVPKLAVKPGNVVWRFEMTDDVLQAKPAASKPEVAIAPVASSDKPGQPDPASAAGESTKPSDTPAAAPAPGPLAEKQLKPEDWAAGRMLVLADLQVIRPFSIAATDTNKAGEFWICESLPQKLQPGDWVVVTPMAAVKGDGTDAVRVYSRSITGQPRKATDPATDPSGSQTAPAASTPAETVPADSKPAASSPADNTASKLDGSDAS
jgi:multidrug efflux pump subunit AcrA (membrane-fusion protein)